jgi:hypothetical protein
MLLLLVALLINQKSLNSKNSSIHSKIVAHSQKSLADAEHECPVPTPNECGRVKRSKARSLLERLVNYDSDVLRLKDIGLFPIDGWCENNLRLAFIPSLIVTNS